MKNFDLIAKFPEILGAALSDTSGALLESFGDMDGEVTGAVHSYIASSLTQAGDALGIGPFQRGTLASPTGSCLIFVQDDTVLGAYVGPNKPASAVEKKISDTLSKAGRTP
jgi:predicted regulator of Ras-like GTPase activity (Roadblock/LC7/MglB family)